MAFLRSLTRAQLGRLAEGLELAGRSDMTSEQLVGALREAGGVPLDDLTNAELVQLGRRRGEPVTARMNKSDLVAALTSTTAS
jgi:hypothetical protein